MTSAALNVTVDEKFARFGAKSYAIAQITSVGVSHTRRARWPWILCAIIAAPLWLGVLTGAAHGRDGGVVAAIVMTLFALAFWGRKDKYHLVLATAGGEVQPVTSTSADEIVALRDAIEAEIARR